MILIFLILSVLGMVVAALQSADKGTTVTIYPDGRMTEQEGDGPVRVLRKARTKDEGMVDA